MFTGLIQDVGRVESLERDGDGARLRIATSLGPEIAPRRLGRRHGVCLTATAADAAASRPRR